MVNILDRLPGALYALGHEIGTEESQQNAILKIVDLQMQEIREAADSQFRRRFMIPIGAARVSFLGSMAFTHPR